MSRLRAPLGLIAAAAMLASHWAAYLLAAPDPQNRAHLLEITGHGYWPFAISLGVAAAVIGLGSFITGSLSPSIRSSRTSILGHAAPRLLAMQVGGFMALEVLERLASGHGVQMATFGQKTLLIGIAVQVLVAALSAIALAVVAFVVDRIAGKVATPVHGSTAVISLISTLFTPRLVPATGAHTLRGPPVRS